MMDETKRNAAKVLLRQNERLMESISSADEEKLDDVLRMKLRWAMRVQLLVKYAIKLEERAEGELLEQLERIAGETDE